MTHDPLTALDARQLVALGMVVLYVGPDQILPLTSALGAVVGVLLMFWHRVVALMKRGWNVVVRKPRSVPANPE